MTGLREAAQMALDALEYPGPSWPDARQKAAEAIRAALAQPEQEPWGYISHKAWKMPVFVEADDLQAANLPFNNPDYTPVYKAPPQREWVGLTDQDREDIDKWIEFKEAGGNEPVPAQKLVTYVEAKLKEKNT